MASPLATSDSLLVLSVVVFTPERSTDIELNQKGSRGRTPLIARCLCDKCQREYWINPAILFERLRFAGEDRQRERHDQVLARGLARPCCDGRGGQIAF